MPRKAKYHKSRGVKRRVNRSYKPKKYGGYKKFGRFKLQRVFKRMPYRSRFNRKLRVRRKAKGQRLHFRIKISPGDVFSQNSSFTFPFLVHCNPRASNESFLNLNYIHYHDVADGYKRSVATTDNGKFFDHSYAGNCLTGVGLLNYHPFNQNRNMSFNPLKALRDTYGKVRVNKIVYQYKPIHYDFAKRDMFGRQYSRPVNIGTNTLRIANQDGAYNYIKSENGVISKAAVIGMDTNGISYENGLTRNQYTTVEGNKLDVQNFETEAFGGFIDRPMEDKRGYIYIWPEVHGANAVVPGIATVEKFVTDIDHVKVHGHCVRKRLDRPFSVSIVPKRYVSTFKNPEVISKYTAENGNNDSQFNGNYEGVNTGVNAGYGDLVNPPDLKVAKKKYWTDNFESEYHGFRYATCYSKGIYSMGCRPLGLYVHENGQELNIPRQGTSHVIDMSKWTDVTVSIRNYYSRYYNDYCGLVAGKFHCYVYLSFKDFHIPKTSLYNDIYQGFERDPFPIPPLKSTVYSGDKITV